MLRLFTLLHSKLISILNQIHHALLFNNDISFKLVPFSITAAILSIHQNKKLINVIKQKQKIIVYFSKYLKIYFQLRL